MTSCFVSAVKPLVGLAFLAIALAGMTSIGTGIYGLVTIASNPVLNTFGFSTFILAIVGGIILLLGVGLGLMGLFRRSRMTADKSGWVTASVTCLLIGAMALAALACIAVYGWISWLEDERANAQRIWASLAQPAIDKIQSDYNCVGFEACGPYLNQLIQNTYKIGAIVAACTTVVTFLCILLLCAIRGNRSVGGRAEAKDVEREYLSREQKSKSNFDAAINQRDDQIRQLMAAGSQKDGQIGTLQRQLGTWNEGLQNQLRESYERGARETQAELTSKWTQRERELNETHRQNLAGEYERGASAAEEDLQDQWLRRDRQVQAYWTEAIAKVESLAEQAAQDREKVSYMRGWEEGQAALAARRTPVSTSSSMERLAAAQASSAYMNAYGAAYGSVEEPQTQVASTPQTQVPTRVSGIANAPPRRTAPGTSSATLTGYVPPVPYSQTTEACEQVLAERPLPPVPQRNQHPYEVPADIIESEQQRPVPRSTVRWTPLPDGGYQRTEVPIDDIPLQQM
jgi:hypothetical protein